jgi:hypothetical protein
VTADLFLGWDVGGWNCDRKNAESRDALCALEIQGAGPVVVGKPWRGNLRDLLVAHEGRALIDAMLERLDLDPDAERYLSIAIDTPLAWPKPMIDLLTAGAVVDVPAKADCNPYLFRAQERELFTKRALFAKGRGPLSAVRDMIGSQSTKGIHFLRRAGLTRKSVGVWTSEATVAVETYPAPAVKDADIFRRTRELAESAPPIRHGKAAQTDVRDAITCALVAWLHRRSPERLVAPHEAADLAEGWIWLPIVAAPVSDR